MSRAEQMPLLPTEPIHIIEGDCLERMRALEALTIDAVVTDPPYGLAFMGAHWDRGMPGIQFWAAALRVAKPGAYLAAFGGTRTYHRLTCAIEDAGWEVRDCLSWLYGSGFPKNARLALKPAWEPIVLARKPMIGTLDENIAAHGTGAINVDGCRIETGDNTGRPGTASKGGLLNVQSGGCVRFSTTNPAGRWPANVLLDEEAAAALDEQSGVTRSTDRSRRNAQSNRLRPLGKDERPAVGRDSYGFSDSGGASRFFYAAKASKRERGEGNNHPTVKPLALMRWLVRLVTPAGGTVLDPFAGSGTTGLAARAEGFASILIEREADYVTTIRRRATA